MDFKGWERNVFSFSIFFLPAKSRSTLWALSGHYPGTIRQGIWARARLADQGFWARARLADLGFALHVFSLLRTVMTPPACTLARAWCGEVTPVIWARGLRPQPTNTHHSAKM